MATHKCVTGALAAEVFCLYADGLAESPTSPFKEGIRPYGLLQGQAIPCSTAECAQSSPHPCITLEISCLDKRRQVDISP